MTACAAYNYKSRAPKGWQHLLAQKQNGCTTISADFQLKSFASSAAFCLAPDVDYYIRISHAHSFKHFSIEIFISKTKMPTPTHIAPRKDSDVFFMSLLRFFIAFKLRSLRFVLFWGGSHALAAPPSKYL